MVTENDNWTNQVFNDTPSTKSSTIILDNDNNNILTVEVAESCRQTKTIRIRLPQSPFNGTIDNSNIRPRPIPLFTVSTVNYQCCRLLKDHSITDGYQDRETTALLLLSPSPQLRIINTSRRRVLEKDIQLHSGQKKKRYSY